MRKFIVQVNEKSYLATDGHCYYVTADRGTALSLRSSKAADFLAHLCGGWVTVAVDLTGWAHDYSLNNYKLNGLADEFTVTADKNGSLQVVHGSGLTLADEEHSSFDKAKKRGEFLADYWALKSPHAIDWVRSSPTGFYRRSYGTWRGDLFLDSSRTWIANVRKGYVNKYQDRFNTAHEAMDAAEEFISKNGK